MKILKHLYKNDYISQKAMWSWQGRERDAARETSQERKREKDRSIMEQDIQTLGL